MEVLKKAPERAFLVGLARGPEARPRIEESLLELRELVVSAGADPVRTLLQERPSPDPAFFIGRGKVVFLQELVFDEKADLVVFDEELTPTQERNLENALEVKVLDRSGLILDIFAQRARSREGKLQVELALLEYRLPRLGGKGTELSRLGGGIGTRGPGETKLETDRRAVRRRISKLKADLDRLEDQRALHRSQRRKVPLPTVSLVGYTNAGKSTLFNALAHQESLVSPRMFATLDPLVRRFTLPSGRELLLSDTVGFIRKLPHQLVAAFHATLEEAVQSDLLLHVIDLSDPGYRWLRSAVYEVLESIGAEDVPVIEVYNKIDRVQPDELVDSPRDWAAISARTGAGLDALAKRIEAALLEDFELVTLLVPFGEGQTLKQIRERGRVETVEYGPEGTRVLAWLGSADLGRFRHLRVAPEESEMKRNGRQD